MSALMCQYCGNQAKLVGGDVIYPHRPDLRRKKFYYCDAGHDAAYVGVHPGTKQPLGTLADSVTRYWRSRAHAAFDPVWRTGKLTRSDAYAILASAMGISKSDCHIGHFGYSQCKQVIEISQVIHDQKRSDSSV
jgi:hypothetical protein